MGLIFLALVFLSIVYRLFRRSCWAQLRRHKPIWIAHSAEIEARVCEVCERPLIPLVRRRK